MPTSIYGIAGAGLGLRRVHLHALQTESANSIDFLELAPENWLGIGGKLKKSLLKLSERYAFAAHGLGLSLGGPTPLNQDFLNQIKQFLKLHSINLYTEHLSYCSDFGHLYDLFPLPFTEESVFYVANRIKQTQDLLERQIAIENISYYAQHPSSELTEIDFLLAVLNEADCLLHVDINNIYVNSVNHNFNASEFLLKLPQERIAYAHIAGHTLQNDGLIIDTHGETIIDPVWALLDLAYAHFGVFPTTLERDTDIPELTDLLFEIEHIRHLQDIYSISKQAIKHDVIDQGVIA